MCVCLRNYSAKYAGNKGLSEALQASVCESVRVRGCVVGREKICFRVCVTMQHVLVFGCVCVCVWMCGCVGGCVCVCGCVGVWV